MIDPNPENFDSLVPPGAHFDGLIEGRGPTRIDGSVEGQIIVADELWIGGDARIRARIEARTVVVEGTVEGEIRAAERIELRETAEVRATLHTGRFVLVEGAHFDGRCHTLAPDSPNRAAESSDSNSTP